MDLSFIEQNQTKVFISLENTFHREFSYMPSYATASIWGMLLWSCLAQQPGEWWTFISKPDIHNNNWMSKVYWSLDANDPLVRAVMESSG
tara:strand:+ start:2854 stop:3123 length:270 start_codon:yes stop_codon:yes gene_type:complete